MVTKKEKDLHRILDSVGPTYVRSDDHKDFGETFSAAAESQTCIQKSINCLILTALKHDVESREELRKVIREVEREDFHAILRKGFEALKWIGTLFLGAGVTLLVQFLSKKLLGG